MAKGGSMRDRARERSQERQTVGGGTKFIFPEGMEVSFFTPKKGLNYIDILPYEVTVDDHPAGVAKGEQWYQRTIWVHFGIGAEDKSYLCLKTFGKRCPICDARGAMMKDPEGDEKLIESLKPKEREVFNVIDLDDEKAGVQLWEYSYHLFGKMLEEEIREGDDDIAGFAELKGGKTLKVRFSEKKMGKNKFLEASRIDFEDRDNYGKDILEDVLDLDEILNYIPYDKLEAVFLEMEDEDAPKGKGSKKHGKKEEEDDEKPSRKRGRRDEEEPEDDDPPSRKRRGKKEEEEPEEKPSRKRGKREEEEPEDDPPSRKRNRREEDEPEEKSSRKRGKKEEEPEEDEKPSRRRGKREEEVDEKPSRKRGKRDEEEPEDEKPSRKSKKDEEDDECPEGYEFGTECDDYNECFECEKWDACKELQDEQKKKKRGKK